MMHRIAIFASGRGSNFEALCRACESGGLNARVVLLVCDRPAAEVVGRARRHGVESLVFSPRDYSSKQEYETHILRRLQALEVELVCLAGYMRLVGETLLEAYGGRMVNLHPSLLPAFAGKDALQQALDYGVKVFGVTVHWVDASLDGGKIIAQRPLSYEGGNLSELEEMIHRLEHPLYVETIGKILNQIDNESTDKR